MWKNYLLEEDVYEKIYDDYEYPWEDFEEMEEMDEDGYIDYQD